MLILKIQVQNIVGKYTFNWGHKIYLIQQNVHKYKDGSTKYKDGSTKYKDGSTKSKNKV